MNSELEHKRLMNKTLRDHFMKKEVDAMRMLQEYHKKINVMQKENPWLTDWWMGYKNITRKSELKKKQKYNDLFCKLSVVTKNSAYYNEKSRYFNNKLK